MTVRTSESPYKILHLLDTGLFIHHCSHDTQIYEENKTSPISPLSQCSSAIVSHRNEVENTTRAIPQQKESGELLIKNIFISFSTFLSIKKHIIIFIYLFKLYLRYEHYLWMKLKHGNWKLKKE